MKRWYSHRFHNLTAHRIVFSTIPYLPRWVHPLVAVVTAAIFFGLLRRERRAVRDNLRRVTGLDGWRLWWRVGRVFYSFCDFVVAYCYVPNATDQQLRSMVRGGLDGLSKVEQCLKEGHGVIVWTAHLGNWEFASRLLELTGRMVNIARVVEDNPAEIMLRDLMTNPRLRTVDLRRGVAATLELLCSLRANEIVAIQGDRVYQRRTAAIPFFSTPTAFPLGPFLLSQVSGAPVVPGFVLRDGWLRYRILMGDVIRTDASPEAPLETHLERAVRFLEQTLRTTNDQWLNFYPFWAAPHD